MSVLVEQQEETINVIETTAAAVEKDTEAGYVDFGSGACTSFDQFLPVSDIPRRPLYLLVPPARRDGFASFYSWSLSPLLPLLWPLLSPTTAKNSRSSSYNWQSLEVVLPAWIADGVEFPATPSALYSSYLRTSILSLLFYPNSW